MLNSDPAYNYNYTDCFEADRFPGDDRSPEQWARAVFEGAPRSVRLFLLAGFRFSLGLRFGRRPSPEHVLGWAIIERGADSVTVESQSWFLTSRLMFQVNKSSVSQATFVRYDRSIAAILWPLVAILHRQIVPRLVKRAAADTVAAQPTPS